VVYLQGSICKGHSAYSGAKGIGIEGAEIVQRLVVHAKGEYEVTEFAFRDVPGHVFPDLEGLADIGFPIISGVLKIIRKRHIFVKPVNVSLNRPLAGNQDQN
jgi:hypothetical protein